MTVDDIDTEPETQTTAGLGRPSSQEAARPTGAAARPAMSFVIPTRNEMAGMEELLRRLSEVIDAPTEVIFVDDSDDATPYGVRKLAEQQQWGHLSVRLVHRTMKQRNGGLGSAVCEGIRRARGEWLCVLDADLQHPPEMIPELLSAAERTGADVVVGSRYAAGGQDNGLSRSRRFVSRSCALAAKALFPRKLKGVSDPLSGFFLLRRDAIRADDLHPHGFKILVEILGRTPDLEVTEVGFNFSERYAGASKASLKEGLRYFYQLAHIRLGAWKRSRVQPASKTYNYDIHGIITVQSCGYLPELARFRVRELAGPPSIVVDLKRFDRRDPGVLIDLGDATPRIRYDETFGSSGFAVEVELGDTTRVWVSHFIEQSPHVMYTNVVEPILRWQFVELGYALVHAACFTDGDAAHLVTARTDTGKTTTMLKILELGDYGFLSDDLVLLDTSGRVLTYPKPLTISNHTVHALKSAELGRLERLTLPLQSRLHSKGGREFAMYLAGKNVPVATLNAFVQRLIPPPKYHVEQLVPGAPTSDSARVEAMHILQRDGDFIKAIDPEQALEILFENCEDAFGFPPYAQLAELLHSCSDDDLRAREHAMIRDGLEGVPTTLYGSTTMGWAATIHESITAPDGAAAASPAFNGRESS